MQTLSLLFIDPMFATESLRQIRAFEYGMASAIIASHCERSHKLQIFSLNSIPIMSCHLAYEVIDQPIHVAPIDLLLCLGPLHTRDWGPVTIALRALSLVEKAEPVQVRFTLRVRDQRSTWMRDGCEVYMDSCMVSNGSCFVVTWTILKDHLLEVGLTQNRETMAFRNLTTVNLLYFMMDEDPAWIEFYWKSIWLRAPLHMTSQYPWGPVIILCDFGSVLERPLNATFGLSQVHGRNSWLVCEVVLSSTYFWGLSDKSQSLHWFSPSLASLTTFVNGYAYHTTFCI